MIRLISVSLIVILFGFSCTRQVDTSISQTTLMGTEEVSKVVKWESKPRPIADGNDGQLLIRASESISLLYAAINKDGKQDLFLSKSRNIGDSFSKRIRVNSVPGEVTAHGENGPKLRQGKGRGIFAAWIGKRDIKFARSMNFGRSFNPSIKVNDDLGKASQSFLTMEIAPDGSIFLAWLDGRDKKNSSPGTASLYIARSLDNGASFEKNIKVAENICPCCRPALAFGESGKVFISWRHVYNDNQRKIVVASSSDNGITWNTPTPVTPIGWKINGCAHSGPALSYSHGNLFVAWYTGLDRRARLKLARSTDKGKTFKTIGDIHGNVLDPNHPHMTTVGNETWIIFQGRDSQYNDGWGRSQAWVVRISNDDKPGKPEALPKVEGGVSYPHLFEGTGERVYALWTALGEKGQKVILCRGRISLAS